MAANTMLKCFKFSQILNSRLSLCSSKQISAQFLWRSNANTRLRKTYATAAFKVTPSEDTSIKMKDATSNIIIKDFDSVEAALSRIDSTIRRNGRTQWKNIYQVFSAINSKEMTTNTHGLYLLRSCKYCYDESPSKRIELVNQIWNRYQELGIQFDVKHFNALLDVHIENSRDFNPAEILASMENSNIEPNKDTYLLIMKKYCQDGNISGASEILEYMKEKQMPANEKVFNYLIEGHIKNNDMAGAKEMVEVMRASNLKPTADTHCLLACGYAAVGNKDEMMNHLKECEKADTADNYMKVINVLAKSGNQQYIDDVLSAITNKERYQQEFINSAVQLIHENFTEIAYKLAVISCNPAYAEGINIFVKQLIKVGKDPTEVLNFYERIQNEGLNENILFVVTKAIGEYGQMNYIVPFYKKMQESGYVLRPKTFWPLFTSLKEREQPEDVWLVLKSMCDLGVPCDFKTYFAHVFPVLGVPNPNDVLNGIALSGQNVNTAADALFSYYCHIEEIDLALTLIESFPVKLSNRFDTEQFLKLEFVGDSNKFLKLLRFIFTEGNTFTKDIDVPHRLLTELFISNPGLLDRLLLKYKDLQFTDYTLYLCEKELFKRSPDRLFHFKKIKIKNAERAILSKEKMSVGEENQYIKELAANNACRPFLLRRLFYHIQNKNVPRVDELLSVFNNLKLDYSPLMLAQLMTLWCEAADLEKANKALDTLTKEFPDFKLDLQHSLDYVILLMKHGKFDESYEAFKTMSENPIYRNKHNLSRSIKKFSSKLFDIPDVQFVEKMQSVLLSLSKELGSEKELLDLPVNIHLQRNDLKSALEEFRSIITVHHVPVCLNMFFKKCIMANEKEILQQVVDLTTRCVSKSYAQLELALSYIETSKTPNALEVIESLGSEANPKILESICERLSNKMKISELKSLILVTKSLSHVKRKKLYKYAINACASFNDSNGALELLKDMEEENIKPDSEIEKIIQDLQNTRIQKTNKTLPLSHLTKDQPEMSPLALEATKSFLKHLEADDSEAALKELSGLKKGYIRALSLKTLTDLIDLCIQKKCVHILSLNTHAMSYILENVKDVLKPILEKYSESGDVEKFGIIASFIPDFALMSINVNFYYCKAYIYSGKYDELLAQLEKHTTMKNKLFSAIAFEELLKFPEYEEKVFNVAIKYLESNYPGPMAVLWANYFSKENYEKADEIYKKFSFNFERADSVILKTIKQTENVSLAKKYVDLVNATAVRSRTKAKAYGTAVDLFVFKGMYDEAVDLVVEAEKQNLVLHKYHLSSLIALKSALEKENKTVPFTLPSDLSSGSSSDSE